MYLLAHTTVSLKRASAVNGTGEGSDPLLPCGIAIKRFRKHNFCYLRLLVLTGPGASIYCLNKKRYDVCRGWQVITHVGYYNDVRVIHALVQLVMPFTFN